MVHPHVALLETNWGDERSTEWLYRRLARMSRGRRARFFTELADYERKHADVLEKAIAAHGGTLPRPRRKVAHVLAATLARLFGVGAVLPVLHRDEAQGIEVYRKELNALGDDACRETIEAVLPDELDHEVELWREITAPEEGAREVSGRGVLRSSILGANDGLGSILALVAGVAGATANSRLIAIAGIAGLIAGAVSMAASNYISVKSERESHTARVELTRVSLELAPDVKREQLKAHYRERGFTDGESEVVVRRLAGDKDEMLRSLLEAEHGLTAASFENPRRLAWWTGISFMLAGAVPIVPFLFAAPTPGLVAAVALSVVALFVAGVLRTLITLRPLLRSGVEMALIGMGSAAATYVVGLLIGPVL